MKAVEPSKVPVALQPVFAEITAITGGFCAEHLDEEYARLCAKLAAKLARKRPSPLLCGDRRIWAAGIVYAIGRVNFLADPAQRPHLRTDHLADLLGVRQTTMANKGRLIMDTLGIGLLEPEYSRSEMLDQNPMVWMIQVNDLIVDARWLPEELQVQAWQRGLIPYVPAHATPDEPAKPSANAAMSTADDLGRVLDIILVDCYGEDEEYSAFLTVLDEEIGLPMAASLLGMPVTVTKLDYHDLERGLVARCDGPYGSGDVALADLAFPADTVAAWLHAAYRHHLGLRPFPATPRPDWTWPD